MYHLGRVGRLKCGAKGCLSLVVASFNVPSDHNWAKIHLTMKISESKGL